MLTYAGALWMDEASTAAWQIHIQDADSAARVEVDEADRAHGTAHHTHSAQQQQQQQAPEEEREGARASVDVAQRGGQQHAPHAQEPGVQEPAAQEPAVQRMHREESLPEQPQEQPHEHVSINKEELFATQPPAETQETEVC